MLHTAKKLLSSKSKRKNEFVTIMHKMNEKHRLWDLGPGTQKYKSITLHKLNHGSEVCKAWCSNQKQMKKRLLPRIL